MLKMRDRLVCPNQECKAIHVVGVFSVNGGTAISRKYFCKKCRTLILKVEPTFELYTLKLEDS